MSDYRIYVIGTDGRFVKAVPLDCPNDDTAIESARRLVNGHDIELWQSGRKVAYFGSRPESHP